MPLLVSTLFGSLFAFLSSFLTKKLAIGATAVAAFSALTLAFMAAMWTMIAGISYALGDICQVTWLLPDNTMTCLSTFMASRLLLAGFRWSNRNIQTLVNS